MTLIRKTLVLITLLTVTLSVAACGSLSHIASSHATSKHHSLTSDAFCAYHSYRLYQDYRHHHLAFGALQGILAAHDCKQVFHRTSR
jgi:hypothetical protein